LTSLVGSIDFDKSEVEGSIPLRFSRQLRNKADAFAVKDHERIISYRRLDALSNQLAHRILSEFGTRPLRVGLFFPLTLDAVAAHLGVWKAGKTCVPIDPASPPARAARILADAGAQVAVTADTHFESACNLNAVERVLEFRAAAGSMSEDSPRISIDPGDPAAIIYTSGSAGRPRGVVHTHRSLLHRCWSDTQYFQITPRDRVSLLTSPSVGAGLPQILSALLNGASLYPFDLQTREFEELYEWLWSERISLFCPPVSVFRQFLRFCPANERYDDCRYVIQAGDATLTKTIEAWRRHFPPSCTLVCQLTSTEAQVVSRYSISHDQPISDRYAPVGFVDCDKQLTIVDRDGNPVVRGAIGELVVASPYLSPGEWSGEIPGAPDGADSNIDRLPGGLRSFHTRDLVSCDDRGLLRHHGRCDSTIKLRGHRIDFSEIETALLEYEEVAEAVCVARELENHRRQLVAFFVPSDPPDPPSDTDLRRWLRSRIPDYMLPARFLPVSELPRTINGKIARRAVENLEIVQRSRGADLHSFENELQRRFVEIWRDAIGHEDIGIDDDFFDIGGDSQSMFQVSAAISRCIGRHVPVKALLELRNIRRLVENLDRVSEPVTCISLLPGTPRTAKRRPLFCIEGFYQYRPLAEALGPSWPSIGVRVRPQTHLLRTCTAEGRASGQPAGAWPPSVEQLAATYIEQIRRHQRCGPYQLTGADFGGVVAFEMARQLTAVGERVSLLGIFHSLAPGSSKAVSLRGRLNVAAGWIRNSIPMAMPDSRADRRQRQQHDAQSQAVALMRYKPTAWRGNAVLFIAGHANATPGMTVARNLGWNRLIAGQLSVHELPGDTAEILRAPAVHSIASMLRPFLDTRPWSTG
jgi:acyl-coenzyme A synthetase/AMP-(fatty) acid ligase/thioesterase domain-containing protein